MSKDLHRLNIEYHKEEDWLDEVLDEYED